MLTSRRKDKKSWKVGPGVQVLNARSGWWIGQVLDPSSVIPKAGPHFCVYTSSGTRTLNAWVFGAALHLAEAHIHLGPLCVLACASVINICAHVESREETGHKRSSSNPQEAQVREAADTIIRTVD